MSEQKQQNKNPYAAPTSVAEVIKAHKRPTKLVVTAGMPYANGPLHLGHLAGTQIPADVYARFGRMVIGADNVLYVNGNDDHGSTSEVAALQAGKPMRQFIDEIHVKQAATLSKYGISTNIFTGTSQPETYPLHEKYSQDFLRSLHKNGMLEKRVTKQWFDTKVNRFLQDRFVRGTCPSCASTEAFSDECDNCGAKFEASELVDPRSQISDSKPELRDTAHWWLNMWKVAEPLKKWIDSKQKAWRTGTFSEASNIVLLGLRFEQIHEDKYKSIKDQLPKHKSRYVAGKKVECLFDTKAELDSAIQLLMANDISSAQTDNWGYRPITRDVSNGIPVPPEIDKDMAGKTLYVWPDSLIAPIVFTQVALEKSGRPKEDYKKFWCDPNASVVQFLGQDNVFFYVIMQGSMWLGSQADVSRQPLAGELQMTEVLSVFHLQINNQKMSKSTGNFFTGDELLDDKGFDADQVRYFLAGLSLPVKASNFDIPTFEEKNKFLSGPMNASFEKPISAVHAKFDGKVPEGKLNPKVEAETMKLVQMYLRTMTKGDYSTLLGQIENYARQINSMFTQFKPHDDRAPEEGRKDALYSCFYVLKNLMIMLYPFAPSTMDRLRQSLNLPESVFTIDQIGVPIPAGHIIGEQKTYFPAEKVPGS